MAERAVADSQPRPDSRADTTEQFPVLSLVWHATWGKEGSGPGEFREPQDLAVIGDMVFVADTGNQRVSVFDKSGIPQDEWLGGEEAFQEPLALGVDPAGPAVGAGFLTRMDIQFDDQGRTLPRMAGPTTRTFHPRGMTVLTDGTSIVADTGNSRFLFLDAEGNITSELGRLGDAAGNSTSRPTFWSIPVATFTRWRPTTTACKNWIVGEAAWDLVNSAQRRPRRSTRCLGAGWLSPDDGTGRGRNSALFDGGPAFEPLDPGRLSPDEETGGDFP